MGEIELNQDEVQLLTTQLLLIVKGYLTAKGADRGAEHNYTVLNALAVVAAVEILGAPQDQINRIVDWFMLAMTGQISEAYPGSTVEDTRIKING